MTVRLTMLSMLYCAVTMILSHLTLGDEPYHWCEGNIEGREGATRDFYNSAARLTWAHQAGDWRDSDGASQGESPYAKTKVMDNNRSRFVQWDVTSLVAEWSEGKSLNKGFLLLTRGGNIEFYSREANNNRPELVLESETETFHLKAVADTELAFSTAYSLGKKDRMRVAADRRILVRFEIPENVVVKSAKLRMFTTAQFGTSNIEVYRCSQGWDNKHETVVQGIAENYPRDVGIASDPSVIFSTGFENEDWMNDWSLGRSNAGRSHPIADDSERKFETLDGKALSVELKKGKFTAISTRYRFSEKGFEEPNEVFFRYYLRLGDDWNQTLQNGKLPGVSGTYDTAGWGGRKSDGNNGWSARGEFWMTIQEEDNPLYGTTPIGSYCYHADMKTSYGDEWVWSRNYRGYLKRDRWYCIEHHVKLNTPGKNDGVLEGWVDGYPAFEKDDIRFRNVEGLKIEDVWLDVYHGGAKPSPHDQHLFIDRVVIAKEYIGPMKSLEKKIGDE